MKKLILSLLTVFLLTSCVEKGDIYQEPQDFIKIHGKIYKLMSIVPCDDCHAIWIMYPKDSTDAMPQVINYNVPQRKTQANETVIKVD